MSEEFNPLEEENIKIQFESCLMSILNKSNNIFKHRHREKQIRRIYKYDRIAKRPEAPHNTTQYLTNKSKIKEILLKSEENKHFDMQKEYTIDNFIITGGSMKGIIHNIMIFN